MRVDSLPESILSRCLAELSYAGNRWVVKKALEKNPKAKFHFDTAMAAMHTAIKEVETYNLELVKKTQPQGEKS